MTSVFTPFGERSSDDVVAVPKGGQIVQDEGGTVVLDRTGKPVHEVERSNEPIGPPPAELALSRATDSKRWTSRAIWENTSQYPIERFTTHFRVPPYPRVDSGQTLFIFNVAQPAHYRSALLPVLQYGRSAAGGGNYWAVATWYITSRCVYHTPLAQVEIAAPLYAAINLTHVNQHPRRPTTYDYAARFSGIEETVLNLRYSEELKNIALVLQGVNIRTPENYPPGVTLFYPTDVSLVPHLKWLVDDGDRVNVTVDVNTPVNGEITFKYPYNESQ
jgi:hypothetical protein